MESTRPLCSITGCTAKIKAHGWCHRHYMQWRRTGDPVAGRQTLSTVEERMARWSHRQGECQVWTGDTYDDGYGKIVTPAGRQRVHRYVWEQEHGPLPPLSLLDHTCHNPPCHRLDHLRLSTKKLNNENRLGAQQNSTTGIRGVYLVKGRYRAQLTHNRRTVNCGTWGTPAEAEAAVVAKRLELFTHSDGR